MSVRKTSVRNKSFQAPKKVVVEVQYKVLEGELPTSMSGLNFSTGLNNSQVVFRVIRDHERPLPALIVDKKVLKLRVAQ